MYIYALIDPDTREIRYIGKTVNVANRLASHITVARQGKHPYYKDRWIRGLLAEGKRPIAIALIRTDEEHWADDERFIIAQLRSAGIRLTNTAAGGEGVDVPHTKEWHAKIGDAHRGKVVTEEQREKIRATLIARTTHCPHGHEYTAENTEYSTKDGRRYRRCRVCAREKAEKRRRERGVLPLAQYRENFRPREECRRGHEMSGENVRILVRRNGKVERICKECVRIRNRAADERARAK